MKGQTYIIIAVIFAVIIAVFAVINIEPVEVNYLFGSGNAPLVLVILFSVLMGASITAAVGVVRMIRLQREIRQLKREQEALVSGQPVDTEKVHTDYEENEENSGKI
ncbi:putative integral membrane protein [Gracilibacillus halotolerans]|uniref:Putative integral membrane protein n=1 Tax=Gracilibacillus halotolerans TaxID=74386 RepID=A0A841RGZ1_9BACI|nr:LapA family protein [Gracilibacillus halotolerans]MBB6511911.1 putative integral membrane protein [Gracilibacillus halotolerans]